MATEHTIEWTATLGDEEPDVVVTYEWTPGEAPTMPSWNDPGDPGYGPEVGIISVARIDNGDIIVLPTDQEQKLIDFICDRHDDSFDDDSYADWRNEW